MDKDRKGLFAESHHTRVLWWQSRVTDDSTATMTVTFGKLNRRGTGESRIQQQFLQFLLSAWTSVGLKKSSKRVPVFAQYSESGLLERKMAVTSKAAESRKEGKDRKPRGSLPKCSYWNDIVSKSRACEKLRFY